MTAGSSTLHVPSYGLSLTRSLTVVECTTPSDCTGPSASVNVTVDDPPPVLTGPPDGAKLGTTISLAATSASSAVRFLIDGTAVTTDTSAPFAATIDIAGFSTGAHTATAQNCTSDGQLCEGGTSAGHDFSIVRPSARVTGLTPQRISPNGDGDRDTSVLRFTLSHRSTTRVVVRDRWGGTVASQTVASRPISAGPHQVTLKIPQRGLSSGRYQVELRAQVALDDGSVSVTGSRRLSVDLTRPRIVSLSRSTSTVYPYHDRYRDTLKISGYASEPLRSFRLVVKNAAGRVVATQAHGPDSGRVSATWNGRGRNGTYEPGRFSVQLEATDTVGNRGHSSKVWVNLSDKRLQARTVTLRKNGDANFAMGSNDRSCADWNYGLSDYAHGVWMSNICGLWDESSIVAAFFIAKAPRAVRYGDVTLSTYGFAIDDGVIFGAVRNFSTDSYRLRNLHIGAYVERWFTLVSGHGDDFVNSKGQIRVAVGVAPDYGDGSDDFDLAQIALTVRYYVLVAP